MKNLRSELQEHRVNPVEGSTRTVDPDEKVKLNATQFCNYCRTNGHTASWCRKTIRDEEQKRIESERIAERKSRLLRTTTKNEDQTMNQKDGLEAEIFNEKIRTTLTMGLREAPPSPIKSSLQDHASHMGTTIRTMEDHMINAQISHSIEAMGIDLEMNLSTIRIATGETMKNFLVPH